MANYYVAINHYRTSTSHGFANTWRVHRCESACERNRLLRDGLPVKDGSRCTTTMGIRLATAGERRRARQDLEVYGEAAVPFV